jgi:hypothetical protein
MSTAEEKVDIAPEAVVSTEEKKTVEPTAEATTTETKGETPTVAASVSNFQIISNFIDSHWAHADFLSP